MSGGGGGQRERENACKDVLSVSECGCFLVLTSHLCKSKLTTFV